MLIWTTLALATGGDCPATNPAADYVIDELMAGQWLTASATGDYDGDGLQDLAVVEPGALALYRGTPDGLDLAGTAPGPGARLLNADLDADGVTDLVQWASEAPESLVVFQGSPTGFVLRGVLRLSPITADVVAPVPLGDTDGDGFDDVGVLVYGTDGDHHLLVFESDPSLPTTPAVDRVVPYDPWPQSVGDVDGDGLYDLGYRGGSVVLGTGLQIALDRDTERSIRAQTAVEDVDGDGLPDIAVLSYGRYAQGSWLELHAVRSTGVSERLWEVELSPVREPVGLVSLGDQDGDGLPEVVLSIEHSEYDDRDYQGWLTEGALQVWELSPTSTSMQEEFLAASLCGIGTPLPPGDVDGDGEIDTIALMNRISTYDHWGWAALVWKGVPPDADTGIEDTGPLHATGSTADTGSTGSLTETGDTVDPAGADNAPEDSGEGCGCHQADVPWSALEWMSRR